MFHLCLFRVEDVQAPAWTLAPSGWAPAEHRASISCWNASGSKDLSFSWNKLNISTVSSLIIIFPSVKFTLKHHFVCFILLTVLTGFFSFYFSCITSFMFASTQKWECELGRSRRRLNRKKRSFASRKCPFSYSIKLRFRLNWLLFNSILTLSHRYTYFLFRNCQNIHNATNTYLCVITNRI